MLRGGWLPPTPFLALLAQQVARFPPMPLAACLPALSRGRAALYMRTCTTYTQKARPSPTFGGQAQEAARAPSLAMPTLALPALQFKTYQVINRLDYEKPTPGSRVVSRSSRLPGLVHHVLSLEVPYSKPPVADTNKTTLSNLASVLLLSASVKSPPLPKYSPGNRPSNLQARPGQNVPVSQTTADERC